MSKHKHADMIKAKADNMDLVVFIKDGLEGEMKWRKMKQSFPINPEFEYFLCLPQHEEACLHWLKGGWVEWTREEENGERWFGKEKYTSIAGWNATNGWMLDDNIYRIKPRKEKRWIAINIKNHDVCLCHEEDKPPFGYQIVEIEVEV